MYDFDLKETVHEDKDSPIKELLTTETSTSGHQLIHFQQEISRNNQEIASLRKQKHDLETALSDLQSTSSIKQEQYDEQIGMCYRGSVTRVVVVSPL